MEDTPPVAPTSSVPPVAAPAVTDRRPSPRGVLPRGVQTWLLAGLAAFMLLIMFVVGRPEAPARPAPAAAPAVGAERRSRARLPGPSAGARGAERWRSWRSNRPRLSSTLGRTASRPRRRRRTRSQTERRRREYESLFASNVVLSRRPESQRPDAGRSETSMQSGTPTAGGTPTVDEIADAAAPRNDAGGGPESRGALRASACRRQSGAGRSSEPTRPQSNRARPSAPVPSAPPGRCTGSSKARSSTPF